MDSNGVITFADEYQELTKETEIYTSAAEMFLLPMTVKTGVTDEAMAMRDFLCLMYCTGKLNGEAGECAEFVFKAFRGGGEITTNLIRKMELELGDVMWYVARIADLLGLKLSDIMTENIAKLKDRQQRDVLHGYGDNR